MPLYEQRDYLDKLVAECLTNTRNYWVYERHQQGHLHVHGIVYDTCSQHMIDIQQQFYIYVGIKSPTKYNKISDIRLLNNVKQWLDYINKHCTSETTYDIYRKNKDDLDLGCVKIEIQQKDDSARYLEDLEQHLKTEPLADTYGFGKNKKSKFVIFI